MTKKKGFLGIVIEIGAILLIAHTISKYFRIGLTRGNSMLPTLKHNRPLFLDCKCYRRRDPKRNDLITFKSPNHKKKIFLKRVIGLPGETVRIDGSNVYINDQILTEPYIKEPMISPQKLEVTVSAETLFVMGDNRNNSLDSRSKSLGLIPNKNVMGVVKRCKWRAY